MSVSHSLYSSHTHATDTILLALIFTRYTCFSFSTPIRISNRVTKETKRKQIFFHLFCPVCVSLAMLIVNRVACFVFRWLPGASSTLSKYLIHCTFCTMANSASQTCLALLTRENEKFLTNWTPFNPPSHLSYRYPKNCFLLRKKKERNFCNHELLWLPSQQ